jgi:hypothetical protein
MSTLYIGEGQGFILKAARFYEMTGAHPVSVRCEYPSDGATANRQMSCGDHPYYPGVGMPCLEKGVDTLEKWKADYHTGGSLTARFYRQCGMGPDKDQFAIFLQARNNYQFGEDLGYANEIVVAAWPERIPEELPLEAFFYLYLSNSDVTRQAAQFMQKDYFESTGKVLPVIRLTFTGDQTRFEYYEEDQLQ